MEEEVVCQSETDGQVDTPPQISSLHILNLPVPPLIPPPPPARVHTAPFFAHTHTLSWTVGL
eukprot:2932155-Rhodomonas_salina.4